MDGIQWVQRGKTLAARQCGRTIGGIIQNSTSDVYFTEVYPAPGVHVSRERPFSDLAAAKRWVKRWAERTIPSWGSHGW